MITSPHFAHDGSGFLCRIAGSDAVVFDVLSTGEELEKSRAFLKGAAGPRIEHVRMGQFGPLDVLLSRGPDDWSVRVFMYAAATGAGPRADQAVSVNLGRAELLKVLDDARSRQSAPDVPALRQPLATTDHAAAAAPREALAGATRRDRYILRSAADIARLMLQVAVRWKVPRIVVDVDAFAGLDRQRAQTRLNHLAEIGEFQSGGPVVAAAVLLVGAADILLKHMRVLDVPTTSSQTRDRVVMLVIAVGAAWLIGRALGGIWCRLRLLAALLRLWFRARKLERKA